MNNIKHYFSTIDDGNIAYHVNDIKENVDKNRKKLSEKYSYKLENLISMNQVHGNTVKVVTEKSPRIIDSCDGIITNDENLTLMVMVADCIPILLKDKENGVIAALHAGRNSTFLKISEVAIDIMKKDFACEPENIEAILGPSIQKCCYEVNDKIIKIVEKNFGNEFIYNKNIDLQGINKSLLLKNGIKNIEISNICTKCSNKPYFSYRKDKKTGRFAGIITIIK